MGHRHVMIYRRTHNVTLIFHNMSVSQSCLLSFLCNPYIFFQISYLLVIIRRWRTWQKCEKHFLRYYTYLTSQINHFWFPGYFSPILHLDIIKSEINFKLKVKMNKMLIYGFSMGIDHSNPYIHSTTVLCDMACWWLWQIVTVWVDYSWMHWWVRKNICYKNIEIPSYIDFLGDFFG